MNTVMHWILTVPVYLQIAGDAGLAAFVIVGLELMTRRAKR